MEESNPLHNSLYQTEPEMSLFTSFNIDNYENDLNKLFPFDFSEDKYCNVIFPSKQCKSFEWESDGEAHIVHW